MNNDFEAAQQALINAQQAVRKGDRQTARRCAEIAASLSPDLEEPWLILAAVGSPRASVAYLERALQINPQSERARLGMHWAVDRMRRETVHGKNLGSPDKPAGGAAAQAGSFTEQETKPLPGRKPSSGEGFSQADSSQAAETRPHVARKIPATIAAVSPSTTQPFYQSLAKHRWSFLTLIVLALCFTAALAFLPGNSFPAFAFLRPPQSSSPMFGAPVKLDKPTYTSTFTNTYTPTETFTPSPTYTLTPTPTETFTPTET
ncbi:MAG: tetratricopeptide repeat protein, partial [Anaerolineales bacterium]